MFENRTVGSVTLSSHLILRVESDAGSGGGNFLGGSLVWRMLSNSRCHRPIANDVTVCCEHRYAPYCLVRNLNGEQLTVAL